MSKAIKINIGDVVEVQHPPNPNWDGIQFRVTEQDKDKFAVAVSGVVVKTVPTMAKLYPVGRKFRWSTTDGGGLVVVKPEPEPTRKINIGDVVEVHYADDDTYAEWNGFRFRVTKIGPIMGEVIKTVPIVAKLYPAGSRVSWGDPVDLVIVEPKNDQPTENKVYIDHIYERLIENATPEELLTLAEKLMLYSNSLLGKGG